MADSGEVVKMPAISFFADERDVNVLLDRLNADPEVAFIIPDGPLDPEVAFANRLRAAVGDQTEMVFWGPYGIPDDGYRQRWKAVWTVDRLKDGPHCLWHVPGGPLTLLRRDGTSGPIRTPWAGWTEQRPGAEPRAPYFGPRHPAVVRLQLFTRHRPYSAEERASLPELISYWDGGQDFLAASDFQWVCDLDGTAPTPTRRWWERLRRWLARSAARLADNREVFWAFPSALQRLKAGTAYFARGWELGEAIRTAKPGWRNPLVRDLLPPRPMSIDADCLAWQNATAVRLARAIYDRRAFEEMPILADTLEEAGCTDADILAHCRGPGPHGRGCWVLGLLLGML